MNSTTRAVATVPPALLVTSALIMVMVGLVGVQRAKTERVKAIPLPKIVTPTEEVVEVNPIEKPVKPEFDETPPPTVTLEPFDGNAVENQVAMIKSERFKVSPELEPAGVNMADGNLIPIVKVAPVYPARAVARGIEGDVLVEYTVTTIGSVKDPVVVSSDSSLLEAEALKSALKYRYKPRVINGQAVEVPGTRTVIKFRLEK